MSAHYAKLEHLYLAAPCNEGLDLKVAVTEGVTHIELPVRTPLHNSMGSVHGAFYFKLLDDATYFAALSLVEDVFLLTASFSIELLIPITHGVLKARGEVAQVTPEGIHAAASLLDGYQREVARGKGLFTRSKLRLDSKVAYSL